MNADRHGTGSGWLSLKHGVKLFLDLPGGLGVIIQEHLSRY